MEIEREMRAHLAELAGGGPASLRVGSSMFFCSYVLPDIVGEFRKEHGSVVVTLSEGSSVALSEKLKDGSLDFMLEAEPPDKNIFESAVWTTEEIILAVPAAFAINGELEEYRCTFGELAASRKGGPRKPAAPPERFAGEEFLILTKWNDLHRRAHGDMPPRRLRAEGLDVPRTDDDGILSRMRGQGPSPSCATRCSTACRRRTRSFSTASTARSPSAESTSPTKNPAASPKYSATS